MYKLLALDIDETTLRHDGTLSQANKDAIIKVKEKGAYVAILTGRSPKAARTVWEKLPVNDICVCFGGAVMVDMRNNLILHTSAIESDIVTDALEYAGCLGLVSQIYVGDAVMTEYENPYTKAYTDYLKLDCIIEPKIREKVHTDIPKLLMFVEENKQSEYIQKLREHFGERADITASTKNFIEINSHGMNKGKGLADLCSMLGISTSEVVAMGDSLIDVPMLEAAGVGIAVANASEKVKSIADVISPDCDNDAVAWAVEKYFN